MRPWNPVPSGPAVALAVPSNLLKLESGVYGWELRNLLISFNVKESISYLKEVSKLDESLGLRRIV